MKMKRRKLKRKKELFSSCLFFFGKLTLKFYLMSMPFLLFVTCPFVTPGSGKIDSGVIE